MTKDDWTLALRDWGRDLSERRKTCDHATWESFERHGRCCPACGTVLVDLGD